jgi:hypothetical protein
VLEKEHKIKRASLFQVLLSYQNSDLQTVNLPGLTFAPLGSPLPSSGSELSLTACDLIVNLRQTLTKLTGSVNYKTNAFDHDVIGFMVETFYRVLEEMAVDVEKPMSTTSNDLGGL